MENYMINLNTLKCICWKWRTTQTSEWSIHHVQNQPNRFCNFHIILLWLILSKVHIFSRFFFQNNLRIFFRFKTFHLSVWQWFQIFFLAFPFRLLLYYQFLFIVTAIRISVTLYMLQNFVILNNDLLVHVSRYHIWFKW
jgi:hypothetical protein